MPGFYHQYVCHCNASYSLVIEDDSNVAYAYLLRDETIVADVWLYNRKSSPVQVEWEQKGGMPFLNPQEYILEDVDFQRLIIKSLSDVEVKWNCAERRVEIDIRGKLVAVLDVGSHVGFSALVKKDGPLARKLVL